MAARDTPEQGLERIDYHVGNAKLAADSGDYSGSKSEIHQAVRAAKGLLTNVANRYQPHDATNAHTGEQTSGRGEPHDDEIIQF
ncbi:hypothetical protein [Kitasatospora griseola]|uniref:hypothetical protein n=1 Tax=Kitasatospora griseola TaxID=2064 RepID=UPI00167086B3|nr:hypothetical protein [Kitasatospora griseola]